MLNSNKPVKIVQFQKLAYQLIFIGATGISTVIFIKQEKS